MANLVSRGALLFLTFALAIPTSRADDRARGAELLARAAERSNLGSAGSEPFRMRARVVFHTSRGPLEGTFFLAWASPELSREVWEVPGFSSILVRRGRSDWRWNSLAFVPFRAGQAANGLRLPKLLKLAPRQTVNKVRRKNLKGVQTECVETQFRGVRSDEACFDLTTGNLLQFSRRDLAYEFSDYTAFGTKAFPFTIRVLEFGKPAAEVKIEELTVMASPNLDLFRPPAGSEEWPNCGETEEFNQAEPEVQGRPDYPTHLRSAGVTGTVTMYAVIWTDGSVRNLAVIRSAHQSLDERALEALRKWRYRPATCGGRPIPVETSVSITFALAH